MTFTEAVERGAICARTILTRIALGNAHEQHLYIIGLNVVVLAILAFSGLR